MRNRLRPWFDVQPDLPALESAGMRAVGIPGVVPLLVVDARLTARSLRDFEDTAILYEMYFDKKQRPLSRVRYAQLMEDEHYSRIGFERLSPTCFVSTIWVGMKHFSYSAEPVIFETKAFQEFPGEFHEIGAEIGVPPIRFPKREELAQERYYTEREALAGHARIVREQRERLAKIS